MHTEANPLQTNGDYQVRNNGVFAIVTLLLVILTSFGIQVLLGVLNSDNVVEAKLWEPSEGIRYFTAPTFAFFSLLLIWICAPKPSQMSQIFKVVSIIGAILYVIYMLIAGFIFALGGGFD